MANQTLLANGSRFMSVKQMCYSPIAKLENSVLSNMYCFLAHVDPWPIDIDGNSIPPVPSQDQLSLKNIMKSIFVAKRISSNDISPVIKRIDWLSGTTYQYYKDTVDMIASDTNYNLVNFFYVKNRYDQVFKCLWNNSSYDKYGNYISTPPSTSEPYFEPGSYNTNNVYQGTDGYKWKFMYTIDIQSKLNFMDNTWMPVSIQKYASNPLKFTNAGYGNIDVINVPYGGSGYDAGNTTISVNVVGQNTSPTIASAVIVNGTIKDIIITNPGTNYISANVNITSSPHAGSGAIALSPVSPIGGHGSDPLAELGCKNVMITSTFTGPELNSNGLKSIPTDITYYQLGIMVNPTSLNTAPDNAESALYTTSTSLICSSGSGAYISDEVIYQCPAKFGAPSIKNATFTGTVLSFDIASNIIHVINTTGYLTENETVYTLPITGSGTTRVLFSYNTPDLITLSGDIMYIDNRSGITRSNDGIEQFKIVLNY